MMYFNLVNMTYCNMGNNDGFRSAQLLYEYHVRCNSGAFVRQTQ